MQGGSRNSGYIQRMLAESPEDFEIDAIENPSAYLQARFSKPIAKKPEVDDVVYDKEGRRVTTRSAMKKLDDDIAEADKNLKEHFKEKQENETTVTTKKLKMYGNLTKDEKAELDEIENLVKGKRITKTDPIGKEYTKKLNAFEKRVMESMLKRSGIFYRLKKVRDDLIEQKELIDDVIKGTVEQKPESRLTVMSDEQTSRIFNAYKDMTSPVKKEVPKAAEIKPKAAEDKKSDWRADAGYTDTDWSRGYGYSPRNRNSQLPQGNVADEGWDWLASKYGKLYDIATDKAKEISRKGRPEWTDKEYKAFIRLPFNNTEQMKEFFRDVLLADPILYDRLNINANRSKAPSVTAAVREFLKWKGK